MASGRFATVAKAGVGVSTVTNWQLTDTQAGQAFIASNTATGTGRAGGIRDWSGTFSGFGAEPPVMPNDVFEFKGYTAPDNGLLGGTGPVYTGNIIISQLTLNYDWAANGLISWEAQFMGKPGLTIASEAPIEDLTFPTKETACNTYLAYYNLGSDQFEEVPKLTDLTLTLTAAVTSEANSSTRSSNICYIDREPGPIDWTISATQQDYERGVAGYPDLGTDLYLRLYTKGETEWWNLVYGRQEGYTNLLADRASNTPIARQLNIAMDAVVATPEGDWRNLGFISVPSSPTSAWWGTYFQPEI